uniref:Large ribosomal subunit protein uL15/eL18 domain-containing protein n=1 Tax=Erpetoichthys calabaricus TaxID=27687 RepID=A0A8C4SC78_ERPCA
IPQCSVDVHLNLALTRVTAERCTVYVQNTHKPLQALGSSISKMKLDECEGMIVALVTVTNDVHFQNIPKLKVCTLTFTTRARNRILKAGGKVITFDQLTLASRKGMVLYWHFEKATGSFPSYTKPLGYHEVKELPAELRHRIMLKHRSGEGYKKFL